MSAEFQMPFFRAIGNHDISSPITQQVFCERHGTTYYDFIYHDALLLTLDREDESRPEPPPDIKVRIAEYNRLQTEDLAKAQKMLASFMSDESVVAALSKPVGFKEYQIAWLKKVLAENTDVRWSG